MILPYVTFEKTGNTITSNCKDNNDWNYFYISIADVNSNVIWTLDGYNVHVDQHGWGPCPTEDSQVRVNITLPQEPVRITIMQWNQANIVYTSTGTF